LTSAITAVFPLIHSLHQFITWAFCQE